MMILKVHVPKTQMKVHLAPCKHNWHLVSTCWCHSLLVNSVRWNIYKGEKFLIHLFLVLLQNQGRSSPLVRLCLIYCTLSHKKTNSPVDVADNHTIALWEVFLYPLSASLCFSCAGEVTAIVIGVMCGCVGLAVIVRFIVKTIRWEREYFFTSVCHYLLWLPVVLNKAGDLQKCVEAATLQSHLYIPSLGRFFTLLHRETVVVNRWFTCFPYWHSCPTDTDSVAFSDLCLTDILVHWSDFMSWKKI